MRYFEIINEGRDAPLYHGTGFSNAIEIIKHDEIKARTNHADRFGTVVTGVSLSRSQEISFDFGQVIFVIDQRKLAQNHKLVPIEYWWIPTRSPKSPTTRSKGRSSHTVTSGNEAEEFCIGSIKPLKRFLISILMKQKSLASLKQAQEVTDLNIDLLLNHPLFKMI